MKKKTGFLGSIQSIIITIVVIGLLWALLSRFNYNITDLAQWIWDGFWSAIKAVANFFLGNELFRNITK